MFVRHGSGRQGLGVTRKGGPLPLAHPSKEGIHRWPEIPMQLEMEFEARLIFLLVSFFLGSGAPMHGTWSVFWDYLFTPFVWLE